MSGLNGQHSGRAGMLSGVAAAIAGMTLNWASSPGNLIPPGFGLTRTGGGATYYDSTGTLQTAAADTARGTHIYNGSAWVFDGTMIEQAATNAALYSRALGTAPWTGTGTAAVQNATGITGVANTAWTLTDASAVAFDGFYQQAVTVVNDSNNQAISMRFLKDANTTTFPALRISLTGGTSVIQDLVINTSTGAFTVQNVGGAGGGTVADEGLWWKLTVYATNNSTGNTICGWQILPGYTTGTTASAATVAAQRAVVVDQIDHRPNSTVTDSPIITAGVAVTRAADVVTATTSGLLVNGQGFAAMKGRLIASNLTTRSYLSTFNGTGGVPIYQDTSGMAVYDDTAVRNWNSTSTATAPLAGQAFAIATTWGGVLCNGAWNGTVGTPQTFDGSMNFGATMNIGMNPDLGSPISLVLQSLRLGVQAVNNSRLANPFA